MSVVDVDPLPPLDLSGSVSDSGSTSESGFVTVIRFVSFNTTRESSEENVERPIDD